MDSQPRPIVHIGYHKTATTWFQTRLWPSLESHDFVPRKAAQTALLAPPGMHFSRRQAAETLDLDARERPPVISEENLSGYIHNGGLHGLIGPEMARRIHVLFPDARIVIFVRNQADMVRASYCQYVAGGGTYGLRRYLDTHARMRGALTRPYKAPAFEWQHFEYDRLIDCYDRIFGRSNVHVYPYEALGDPACLLARMERDLRIRFRKADVAAGRVNRSPSAAALRLMRLANLFTRQSVVNKHCLVDLPGGQALRHAAKFLLKGVGGPPFRLPDDVSAEIRRRYAASNRRLGELRDLPLDAFGYVREPQPPDGGDQPFPASSKAANRKAA